MYTHDTFKNFVRKIDEKGGSISVQNTIEYSSGEGEKVPDLDSDPDPERSTQCIGNDKSLVVQALFEIGTLSLISH